mmetsp:Transcript_35401/g.98964  ORF Transcript_35401/g.98964 Transcript_35401/m.98964 type:complete len:337 (-) Transcript_35401:134-1144(-)
MPTVLALGFFAACGSLAEGVASRAVPLGEQLFEGAMPYVKLSLHGEFIRRMVDGTLPAAAFEFYLRQDNLYLSKYARAFALLAARADQTDEFEWLLNSSIDMLHEHGKKANIDVDEKTFEREASPTTRAYTSFFMQASWGEGNVLGYSSLLACQRLYDWLFSEVKATMPIADDNPYKKYIEQYADPTNHQVTVIMEGFLERYAAQGLREETLARAQYHFNTAMQYEAQFFQQGLDHCAAVGCDAPPSGEFAALGGRLAMRVESDGPSEQRRRTQEQAPVAAASGITAGSGLAAGALAFAALGAVVGGGVLGAGRRLRPSRSDAGAGAEAPFVRQSP